MSGEIPTGAILQHFYTDNQGLFARQTVSEPLRHVANEFAPKTSTERQDVADAFDLMLKYVPATEIELGLKMEESNKLRAKLDSSDPAQFEDFLNTNLRSGLDDLSNGVVTTSAAIEALNLARGLIGLKLQAIKETNEIMGRSGPPTMEAQRQMELHDWREKYGEKVEWRGREGSGIDSEVKLAQKMCNVLLTTGVDGSDINGLIRLIQDRKSAYGSFGDYANAFAKLIGNERQGAGLKNILAIGSRSGVDIKGLDSAIESLTPGDIVAFANITWSLKVGAQDNARIVKISVGEVLEKLLDLPGGRNAWTNPYWAGETGGADAYLQWLKNDKLRNAVQGMELEPGFSVYPDGFARPAGVMDGGLTRVEDIPEDVRNDRLIGALMDSSAISTLYVAARALGILTQPIQRLYGKKIMEALPAIQKIYGPLYEKHYKNQSPFYRLRSHISLMAMADRAVTSPLDTIKPLATTMDGFAFLEKRDQGVARAGIFIDEAAVERDIRNEQHLEGIALREEKTKRLNELDVVLLNIWGCPIDFKANFQQEVAVAKVVGAMNDVLITPDCSEIQNPIQDMNTRRELALAHAQEYFTYMVELGMSYTDSGTRSLAPLTDYVKYVHVPPEMIKNRLQNLPDKYKELLDKYVDFSGLLKRWKWEKTDVNGNTLYEQGPEPDINNPGATQNEPRPLTFADGDPTNWGVKGALKAVEAMRGGVLATLPGGTKDLNTPFPQKQGGYWERENEMFKSFVKGYPLSLQAIDDEAQVVAGVKIGTANEMEEKAFEIINRGVMAFKGVNANEKIRSGAIDEYIKWVRETAPMTTYIGGQFPVVSFFQIACTVAASMVGKEFVPPYLDKDRTCFIETDRGKRLHVALGANDDVMEYGSKDEFTGRHIYPNLPDDILALIGVEKNNGGECLMSPGRITPIPVIGMEMRKYTLGNRSYRSAGPATFRINPGEIAGSKKVFPTNKERAYSLMVETTFNHICDVGLANITDKAVYLRGMESELLPEN